MTALLFVLPFVTFASVIGEQESAADVAAADAAAAEPAYEEYYQQVSDGVASVPKKKKRGWFEIRATEKSRCDIGGAVVFALTMVAVASAALHLTTEKD